MPCGITVFPNIVRVEGTPGHLEAQGTALGCTGVWVRIHREILQRLDVFRDLGRRLGSRDYSADTLKKARQAAEWFPQSTQARFYLGNLEMVHGDLEKAERLLRQVAQEEPANVSALLNLAQALRRMGRADEAAAALQGALRLEPNNAFAKSELASMGR